MKVVKKILLSIIAVPLGILGAICLIPFIALILLIDLPRVIIEDIWYDGKILSSDDSETLDEDSCC